MNRVLGLFAAALVAAAFLPTTAGAAATPTTWCGGTNLAQVDRKPDVLAGHQVSVIYAHPADTPDRFGTFASSIASDVAAIDAWWRAQDAARTIRFDLFPFQGCASTVGRLDLADIPLTQGATFYRDARNSFQNITGGLISPPMKALEPTRKYLVYWDAPISDGRLCGQGSSDLTNYATGPSWAIIYLQSCGINVGDGNLGAAVAAHELLHTLGAVGAGAPHECPAPNDGHVCDNTLDILYPFLSPTTPFDALHLDPDGDDYYGNGGAFDLRNSSWLEHLDLPQLVLTVTTTGSGTGHVTSDAGAVDCPGACTTSQEQGSELSLSASAADGSRFAGWSGACSGTDECAVTLDTAKSVKAAFSIDGVLALSVAVRGNGRVVSTPAGIDCRTRCSKPFPADTVVTLRAVPARGYRLGAWSGACSGHGGCSVQLVSARSVQAVFAKV